MRYFLIFFEYLQAECITRGVQTLLRPKDHSEKCLYAAKWRMTQTLSQLPLALQSFMQIVQIGSVVSVQTSEEVQRSFSNWLDVIPQTSDPFIREIGSRQPLTFRELHAFAQDLCAEYY